MISRTTLLALVLLLLSALSASAQTSSIVWLTTREGLAGNFVTALAFEPNGDAWVGTTAGVTHLQGTRWTSYTREHGLGDGWVNAIALGPDGRAWFATNGGLAVFDKEIFTTYVLTGTRSIPSNFVTAVAVARSGTVWAGTLDAGVARFEPAANRWTRYTLPNRYVTALALDAQGRVWAGTEGGLFRYDAAADRFVAAARGAKDAPGETAQVTRLARAGDGMQVWTRDGFYAYDGAQWRTGADPWNGLAAVLGLKAGDLRAAAQDASGRIWGGTARGLYLSNALPPAMQLANPLPVVLVHGWTGPESDRIEDSEFRFLQQYAARDGISVYFAEGINPKNTLFQNAAHLRDDITRVKQAAGGVQVNIVAFSMGGLNTRALLESSLYASDVHRAIILGTPQAGVDIWYPVLTQQILDKPDQPSAIELTPEFSQLWNATHAPRPSVPYDLVVGDATRQFNLPFISELPPSDGLIGVYSALALHAPNVRKAINGDLHAFDPTPFPIVLTSYLYPAQTYYRFLRNALRDPSTAPLSKTLDAWDPALTPPAPRNHTALVTTRLRAGETVTRAVALDANSAARFIAYYPGGSVDLALTAPDGERYTPGDTPIGQEKGALRLTADFASFTGYAFKNAAPGRWLVTLHRTDAGAQPVDVLSYVDLDAPVRLDVSLNPTPSADKNPLRVGTTVSVRAALTTTRPMTAPVPSGVQMTATLAFAQGSQRTFRLLDDGMHNDGAAGDGVFALSLPLTDVGYGVLRVQASSATFERETETVIPVSSDAARLTGSPEVTRMEAGLLAQAHVNMKRAGSYAAAVTLRAPDGSAWSVSSDALSLATGDAIVPILFPNADLRAWSKDGPYKVDVRLMDVSSAALLLDAQLDAATTPAYNTNDFR